MQEEQHVKKAGNKKKRFLMLGIVAGLITIISLLVWIGSIGHETTDNAQVETTIIPLRNIVQGFVVDIRFEDNQSVQQGDTLLVIDDKDYQSKVIQAQAALESAEAQLTMATSGELTAEMNASASSLTSQAAKENIATAQAKYTKNEKELARVEKMFKDGAATQQQLESVKAEFETSRAQWMMLKKQADASSSQAKGTASQVDGQRAQIGLARALVKQRLAELALARTQLENTVIKAPFDGVISKKSVEIGQYLQSGVPICSAVDLENVWIGANFKETQIENMRVGQTVDITLDAFPGTAIKGKIQSFGGATGAKFSLLPPDNSTGNFVKITQRVPVRIQLQHYPSSLKGMILPGLSAEVDVHTK